MKTSQTLPEALGAWLAQTRQTHRFTLDQIAQAGRRYGATWSASSVRNLERGQAAIPLQTLMHLALALGDLTGRPQTLSDLFGDAQSFSLDTDHQVEVTRNWLDRMLTGDPLTLTPDDAPWMAEWQEAAEGLPATQGPLEGEQLSDALDELINQRQLPPEPVGASQHFELSPSLAEKRAAEKLDMHPAELQRWATKLWGHALEEESARRASPEASPQARGRVTRKLVDEIRAARDKYRGDV